MTPAPYENDAVAGVDVARQGVFSRDFGRGLSAPPALWDAPEHQDAPLAAHDLDQGQSWNDPASLCGTRMPGVGRESPATLSPVRFGGHRVCQSVSLGRGGHGAGVSHLAALELGVPQAGRGTPLHPAGLAPLARVAAPAVLARHHGLRGTALTPRQEAFPRSAEGGPNSVEEKTPAMSETVILSGVDAPARAPLLRSPANPDGPDLRDLLGRVRDELAAQNAPLRGRHGSMDQPEYALRQEVLKALTHADSLASQLTSVMALRVRAAAEEAAESRAAAGRTAPLADDTVVSLPLGRKLPGGAYHPSGWPARDAA